ncbi:VRR-NUC domain-containing protein, partial [Enterococcus cecorum]
DCDYLNELTLSNVVRDFKERFERRYSQSYHYEALDFQASTSIFDVNQNEFKDDVLATLIGVNEDFGVNENDNRQLYEFPPIRYDSVSPERELLKYQYPKEVIAFGKLPKKAIQIPKYMGGSTTPDFVYLVEKVDGSHIYLLIETKAEGSGKRISDQQIIEIQHKFFDRLKSIGVEYQEASSLNDVRSRLRKVVDKNEK